MGNDQATITAPSVASGGRPAPDVWKAVFWAGIALLSFSLTAISGRETGKHMTAMHMVFYRNAISLVILLIVLRYLGVSLASLKTVQPGMQWGRALVHFCGQWAWMAALLMIPLIELTAIEFTFPLLVALLAPYLLGEQLTKARIVAAIVGFIGTLTIILGPYVLNPSGIAGAPSFNTGTLLAVFCAVCFAFNLMGTRYLTRKDGPLTILLFMTVNHTILAFLLGVWTMRTPPLSIVPWIVVLGVSSLVAHFALARALAYADAIVVAPMDFLRIPLLTGLGMLLYNEQLQTIALVGTALVLAGNIVNVWGERQAVLARRK